VAGLRIRSAGLLVRVVSQLVMAVAVRVLVRFEFVVGEAVMSVLVAGAERVASRRLFRLV